MADITGFRASMLNGMVRPNTFRVTLNFPGIVSGAGEATLLGRFHCKAAALPESTITPVPVFFQGRAVPVAGEREFQPWTVAIYNENFIIRDTVERWMNSINNIQNNGGIIQPALYESDMMVEQLDRNGAVLKAYKMIGAFPINIGAIELDFEANNQVEIFPVTFAYTYYESSNVTSTGLNTLMEIGAEVIPGLAA